MHSDFFKNIIKIIVALLKHQAENLLGKEAIGIAGQTFVEIGGEKLQAKIDTLLNTTEGAQKLSDAALRADSYFRDKCTDQDLQEAFTIPMGDLSSIQTVLKDLPKALDQENALIAIQANLATTFPKLKQNQIDDGSRLYLDCLNRALLPLEDFTLSIIGQTVLDSKQDIKEIKAKVEEVLRIVSPTPVDKAEISPPLPEFDPLILENMDSPGGALKITDPFYVERDADKLIKKHIIKSGSTIIIRASHQAGKSSLLARGIHCASDRAHIVHINLQGFEHNELEIADTFYKHFAKILIKKLRITNSVVDEVWQEDLSPLSKLNDLVEEYIVYKIDRQVILAIDEADRLLFSPFRNDFFGLMRTWHNNRAIEERWNKVNVVLVISTEPDALISSFHQSPFNVGLNIYLDDFNWAQVYMLNKMHGSPVQDDDFETFFELIDGHPYLTREALYLLVSEGWTFRRLLQDAAKDHGPFGNHLRRQFSILLNDQHLQRTFAMIRQQNRCGDEIAISRLLQAGLIKGKGDLYYCRCGLYNRYFVGRFK
jgi:hypothetical protein